MTKWTPVKKGLPEQNTGDLYLITISRVLTSHPNVAIRVVYEAFLSHDKWVYDHDVDEQFLKDTVIAWALYPKPYDGEIS